MKPAEVRRNDAVGQAVTIPYSRCHSQARVVADPTKNHRHSHRSWHPPEEQRAARIKYESYGTSFVIWTDSDSFLIQPVCCTYRRALLCKPSPTCQESPYHLLSATGEINWRVPSCCHPSSSQLCHASPPLHKGRCANSFSERRKEREFAIHHFSQRHHRKQTAPPSFPGGTELQDHATFSVPRPSEAALHSALQSPSKSRADYERTQTKDRRTNSFSTHCCAPHPHRGATESSTLWPRTAAPVTPSSAARLPRACHTPQWATAVLFARSSRIVRHGVS